MSDLVDPYGYPVSSRQFADISQRQARPHWPTSTQDQKKDVPDWDRRTLVSYSRRLYAKDGLVKGAIDTQAQHAIGRSWNPVYLGKDKPWGDAAQGWLMDEWMPVCDVRGEQFDFKTNLFNDSVALDVDGDFAVILTEQGDGYPATQHIPAHKLGQRSYDEEKVEKGPLKGFTICQGIITNEFNRIVGLRILGETEKDDRDEIANNVIFCFNATRADQVRGLPTFSHAIAELRDAWQSQQWEQLTHQAVSGITLQEFNETGSADVNDPGFTVGTTGTDNETFSTQTFGGGLVRMFKAGSGSKLEELVTGKPGPQWEAFQDRIFRKALVGGGFSYSLHWKSDGLNGPAERSQIELVRATILDRQDLLMALALRQIRWAIAKYYKREKMALADDWWKWSFTLPAKFSIDNGRDGQSRREDYKLGHKNLRDILGEQGIDYTQHMEQRRMEIEDSILKAQELSAATGVPFETVLNLFQQRSPNPIMAPTAAPTQTEPE